MNISKLVVGNYAFKNAVLKNLKSLKRSGDAFMSSESRKVTITSDLTLQEMVLTADEMSIKNSTITVTSPTLKFQQNVVNFLFQGELDTKSGCNITKQLINWKQLAGTIFSNNPEFNEKSFYLTQQELDEFNIITENNQELLKFLNENMIFCPTEANLVLFSYSDYLKYLTK